jgi:predicted DNA-binding transcriptional regulator YafY
MDSPTSRVLALLELLQSFESISGTELARRLEVDERTLRRYIAKLQGMGIPVESERGRYGAYRLKAGSKLPPLMFSNEEALAISVGLVFAGGLGLDGGVSGARSAQLKLERVTPKGLGAKLRALTETMQLERSQAVSTIPSQTLLELSDAAHLRRRVQMGYCAANGELTEREFDCYGLSWRSGRWYAVGHCHLRGNLRSFRLDRIDSVTSRQESFVPPMNFDAVRHLALGLASIPRKHAVSVLLKTDIVTARAELFEAIGLFVPAAAHVMLHSQVDDLHWYARQLARLSFDFVVVEPAPLRQALRDVATRLRKLAGSSAEARADRESVRRPRTP